MAACLAPALLAKRETITTEKYIRVKVSLLDKYERATSENKLGLENCGFSIALYCRAVICFNMSGKCGD